MSEDFDMLKPRSLEAMEDDFMLAQFRAVLREQPRLASFVKRYTEIEGAKLADPSLRLMLLGAIDDAVTERFGILARRAESIEELDVLAKEAKNFPFTRAQVLNEVMNILHDERSNRLTML